MPATRTSGQAAFITPATPPRPAHEEITPAATPRPTATAARRIIPATAMAPVTAPPQAAATMPIPRVTAAVTPWAVTAVTAAMLKATGRAFTAVTKTACEIQP